VQEVDELVVLEDLLVEKLPSDSEVHGHDLGVANSTYLF
jgi:hypothetical protein